MNKNKNKNMLRSFSRASIFSITVIVLISLGFWVAEPGIVGAASDTDDVVVNLTVAGTISIDSPTNANMSPDITGTGASTGSVVWTVTTNNSSGYKLEVETDQVNTMHSGSDVFTDYTEADNTGTEGTPETWNMDTDQAQFGFGATGTNIETKFGVDKYMGFNSTTKEQIAHESAETTGSATTVIFKAEVGSAKSQPTGSYTATVTATATTL